MPILPGDIVHLSEKGRWYDGLFMVVEEVRAWGLIGHIKLAQGDAPVRINWNIVNGVYRKVEAMH